MRPIHLLLTAFAISLGACHSAGGADKMAHDTAGQLAGSAGPASAQTGSAGGQQDTSSVRDNPSTAGDDSEKLSRLRERFADAPLPFAGLWVNEHYVDEIRQGKPWRESQDTNSRCIEIPPRTLLVTRMISGFHDGASDIVFVQHAGFYFTFYVYDGQCKDTVGLLSDGRLKMGQELYIRLHEDDSSAHDLGILEQLQIAGKYKRSDGSGVAVFATNGKVEGLDSIGWYEPVIDYADFNTHVDHIRLGRSKRDMDDYGVRFAGDTMMIYSIDCRKYDADDCIDDTLGRRLYMLTKVRS